MLAPLAHVDKRAFARRAVRFSPPLRSGLRVAGNRRSA